jgi:hypothetical protein
MWGRAIPPGLGGRIARPHIFRRLLAIGVNKLLNNDLTPDT